MQQDKKGMDRRQFLTGALATGALATAGVLAGCAAEGTPAETSGSGTAESGFRSWEVVPDPIPDAEIAETVETDLLVVGVGIAGMSAIWAAAEAGGKVIGIEKMEGFSARGLDNGAIDTKWQLENGIQIPKRLAEENHAQWSGNKIDRELYRVWADHSGPVFDVINDRMIAAGYEPRASTTTPAGRENMEVTFREWPSSFKYADGWFMEDGRWIENILVGEMEKWALAAGGDIRYQVKAEQLVRTAGGPVTGVIASKSDGTYVKFNAAKGVILATGDIGGNPEMLEAWAPLALKADANVYTPAGGNTGDGILMGLWAGAAIQKGNAAPMIHPLPVGGPLAAMDVSWLHVNRNGKRFMNEWTCVPYMTNARMMAPGNIAWAIFDAQFKDKALRCIPDNVGIMGKVIDETTIDASIETGLGNGTLLKADTLEGLAQAFGADPAAFKATVDRYNELCAKGVDEDWGKPARWLYTTVDTPPYYASKIPAALLTVPFGLNVDLNSQVCDAEDNPIEGLYAIGNVQGNFFANDYPLGAAGVSHGRCVVFGKLLAEALVGDTTLQEMISL